MEYTILILLLPFVSFLVLGLAGMKMRPVVAGIVGTAVLAVVALLSYYTAFEYFTAGRDAVGVFPTLVPWNTVWLPIAGALHIDLGILLDPISVMMLVVISTVSLMVHIYSFGYMKGEQGFQRYYAFLSLPCPGSDHRYVLYLNQTLAGGKRIILIYMEGSAGPESIKAMLKKN